MRIIRTFDTLVGLAFIGVGLPIVLGVSGYLANHTWALILWTAVLAASGAALSAWREARADARRANLAEDRATRPATGKTIR